MLRRKFIACLAGGVAAGAAWPLAVHAQRPNGVRRIGVLEPIYDPMIRSVIFAELAQRGFVDGRNLVVDVRIGNSDEMPKLARELVAADPEVIIAVSDWALHPARDATKLIPIVASPMGADPVVAGVAVSWARPGGNVTGVGRSVLTPSRMKRRSKADRSLKRPLAGRRSHQPTPATEMVATRVSATNGIPQPTLATALPTSAKPSHTVRPMDAEHPSTPGNKTDAL